MAEGEGFSYANPASVKALMKASDKLPPWKENMINEKLIQISARLSAWYPTLKSRWLNADEEDPIVDFIPAIVSEAVKKYVDNPDGMSSETMGPYAYSRFDSQDIYKTLFNERDLKALEALLDDTQAVRRSVQIRQAGTYPAAPMPKPGVYTNTQRWKRREDSERRRRRGIVW